MKFAAICWTFTKNVQNTLGIPRIKMICSSCVVIADSWTSEHQGCLGWPVWMVSVMLCSESMVDVVLLVVKFFLVRHGGDPC